MNSRSVMDIEDGRGGADELLHEANHERRTFRPYILVLTASVLHPEGTTVIDYQRLKHIPIPRNVSDGLLVDQIAWVSRTIVAHFIYSCGIIGQYGAIEGYVYRREHEVGSVLFNTDGKPTNYFASTPIEVGPHRGVTPRRAAARTARLASPAAASLLPGSAVGDNLSAR
jgi:hypothetical protein